MAPKSAYEEDYKAVFAPFGTPIDIYVIRDRNGFSKGCAFVRYETVQSATDAIEALHDKYVMPGGFRTLVVTIADDRRASPHNNGTDTATTGAAAATGGNSTGAASGEWAHSLPPRRQCAGGGNDSCGRSGNSSSSNAASLRGLTVANRPTIVAAPPQIACASPGSTGASSPSLPSPMVSNMPYLFCGGGNPPQGTYVYYPYVPPSPSSGQHATTGSTTTTAANTTAAGAAAAVVGGNSQHAFAPVGSPAGACSSRCDPRIVVCADSAAGGGGGCGGGVQGQPRANAKANARGLHEDGGYIVEGTNRNFGAIGPEEKGRRWAKQSVGPMGANLFVYYLPGSLTDEDLASAFAPFGEVLSAKVYYDRDTGESKGFGKMVV